MLLNVVGPHSVDVLGFRLGLPAAKSCFELKDGR
jgi:hypothetical protein